MHFQMPNAHEPFGVAYITEERRKSEKFINVKMHRLCPIFHSVLKLKKVSFYIKKNISDQFLKHLKTWRYQENEYDFGQKNETFLNEFQTTVFSVSSFENVAMVLHTFWRLTLDAELKCIAELIACHRVRIHMGPLDHRSKILTLLNVHPSFPWINCLLCIAMQASFQNRDNTDSTYGSASIDLSLAT